MTVETDDIAAKLTAYYENRYRDQLRLPDWKERVALRLKEEEVFGEVVIRKLERWLNYDFADKRVLVVGTGTGAESIVLGQRGADVYGLEPNHDALTILKLKSAVRGIDADHFVSAMAEDIPFPDEYFDFIYCFTVLEHVQDVARSIDEMIRVCRTKGYVFLSMPDYRFPYEGHYKLRMIPLAPKFVQRIFFMLRGRYTKFFEGIQFLTEPALNRILWNRDVLTIRFYEPSLLQWKNKGFFSWFTRVFVIPKNQYIVLVKGFGS